MAWTAEAIRSLRLLWAATDPQLSASEIGRRLGTSKNAVVGKASRLNLPARPSPIPMRGSAKPKPERNPRHTLPVAADTFRVPKKATVTPAMLLGRAPAKKTLEEVQRPKGGTAAVKATLGVQPVARDITVRPITSRSDRGCLWPIGEPRTPGFRFCAAAEIVEGKVYCPEHCALAFVRHREEAA